MTKLVWDQVGERLYETGVNKGVLYMPNNLGVYNNGVAWNGLTTVTESPSGAESTALYADNIKYLNIQSAEEFGATIEAYTYPREFGQYDGTSSPTPGVLVGQQARGTFGLSYQTRVGNDLQGSDFGYKIHLIYGCKAAPSEKAYATINDSPEAITFSWELTTAPVSAGDELKPTSVITIDSTEVDADSLAALETILYGAPGVDPRLPLPEEVIGIFDETLTSVNLAAGANQPSYNTSTHVVTLPAVTGVTWYINGDVATSGAQPALGVGETANVEAVANTGYSLAGDSDWAYSY
jgi:hypothetical protein